MRGLVLTGYTDNLLYGHIGEASWRQYANLHGHEFHCQRAFDESTHPSWQKLDLLLTHLPQHDWIFWTDIDSVCTNTGIRLEPMMPAGDYWMTVSQDWGDNGKWSAGHMLIKSCRQAAEFFKKAQKHTDHANRPLWDQSAMHAIDDGEQGIRVLDGNVMGSVPSGEKWDKAICKWKPGDFQIHVTGLHHEKRYEYMSYYSGRSSIPPGLSLPAPPQLP